MNEPHGRCPQCGGEKQLGSTTFAVDLKFGVVIVREVPALVCDQCGEAWIEDAVAERLEQVVSGARTKQVVVEVSNWNEIAA